MAAGEADLIVNYFPDHSCTWPSPLSMRPGSAGFRPLRQSADGARALALLPLSRSNTATVTLLTMGREGKKWERRVRRHFDFLLGHGFAFDGVDDSSFWQTNATYLSDLVGIEIANSREMNRVEIDLIRLHDGRLPE